MKTTILSKLILCPVLFFIIVSCGNKYEKGLDRKIILASNDKKIDNTEISDFKTFLKQFEDKNDKFIQLLKSDSALYSKIHSISAGVTIDSPELPKSKLNKIRFYIETSESMGGYMNGGTEFQDAVNNLIGILGGEYNFIHFFPNTITSTIGTYSNVDQYRRDLTTSRFQFGGHSPIDEMFRIIIDSSKKNDVNFLVTDAIMSGSNNDVKNNPQYNIEQRTLMLNLVRSRFEQVKDAFGVSIYGFKSRFNTNPNKGFVYYTYNNTHINSSFQRRPFFVFVFGDRQLVNEINGKLKDNTFFTPEKELHFGIQQEPVKKYALFHSHLPRQDQASCFLNADGSIKCNIIPVSTAHVKFGIGLDLSEMPDYAKTVQYLGNNLKINTSNNLIADHSGAMSPLTSGLINSIDRVVELPRINKLGCTHYLNIDISSLFSPAENLNIQLLKEEDKWYEDWSCDDDSNIQSDPSLQERTFNLKRLIWGIREAYKDSRNDKFIEINVPVKNK
jgi:hypothetical protein